MTAVWMRALNDLRARWRGALVLILILGVVGGVVMTAAAGARRTTTAYERLLRQSKAYDVEVQITGDAEPEILDRVAALPQVADSGRVNLIPATVTKPGTPVREFKWNVSTGAILDEHLATTFEIPRLVSGRTFDRSDPHEALMSEDFAKARNVRVGDAFTFQTATFPELSELFGGRFPRPTGPIVTVHIVGIWKLPHDIAFTTENAGILYLTPAFYQTYGERIASLPLMDVRLRNGTADVPEFTRAARRIGGEDTLALLPQDTLVSKVDRALGVQSSALWILAGVVAAGAALILGQALLRWLTLGAGDDPVLRAFGMNPAQRAAAAAIPLALVGAAAGIVAVIVAILASPLVPVGFTRTIEPALGIFADVPVLAIASAAIALGSAIVGWTMGMRMMRRAGAVSATRARPSSVAGLLARSGAPPTAVAGARFAFEPGSGRAAVPVRSVIAGAVLSLVAVAAAFTFGRSMARMFETPSSYGWNWDAVVFGGEDPQLAADIEKRLAVSDSVASASRVDIVTTSLRGSDIAVLGVTPIRGRVYPTLLAGSYPASDEQVALATKTMRKAGVGIGGTVRFPGSADACRGEEGCSLPYRVVARIVGWGEGTDPDEGAAFTSSGLQRLRRSGGFSDFLVRFPSGADVAAQVRAFERQFGDATAPMLPANLQNVARVRSMPNILAAVLAALALATLLHALVTSMRRRAHDIGILKSLGFVRGQVAAAFRWQATGIVAAAILLGVPAGIAAGRWAWILTARQLGVAEQSAWPLGWLAAGAVGLLLLANLAALGPARVAARTQPALVLRTE